MVRRTVLVLCMSVLICASCGGQDENPIDLNDSGPLEALPACGDDPTPGPRNVKGLDLPPGAIVTRAKPAAGGLINVRGYIEMTPIQIRLYYEKRRALEFFFIEDEIFEAEVFFSNGRYRNYVKARASCDRGSDLFVFVAPEKLRKGIPTPTPGLFQSPTLSQ